MNQVPIVRLLDHERGQATAASRKKSSIQFWLVGLICLGLLALLDFFLVLDHSGRAVAFAGLGAVAGWRMVRWVQALRLKISRKEIAGTVESQSGRETVVLTTAADEHVRKSSATDSVGVTLLQRLDNEAIKLARTTPLQTARTVGPWRWALCGTIGVLCLFALSGGWWSYTRILAPWAPLSYTGVDLAGPQERIASLAPFRLTGAIRGRTPDSALLHTSLTNKPTAIPVGPDGEFEVNLPGVAEDSTFWVTAGDGWSQEVDVRVFKPAEFAEFKIQVVPPEYAEHLAVVHDNPNLEVLRGSKLDYRVRLSEEVQSLNLLILRDGSGRITGPVPFERTDDPLVYRLKTDEFSRDLRYRLEATNIHGDVSRNDEPFRILTLDDDPPLLTITGHNGKKVIKTGEEDLTVKLKATDDVGVETVRLVYRKIGKPGESKGIPVSAKHPLELKASSLLELAPLQLQPLDIIAIHAEGQDGNTYDGPGIGKSQIVMIEVPEPPREEEDTGGGGGGGGGQVINPLAMQKYILSDTSKLIAKSNRTRFANLQKDQEEVNGYAETLLGNVKSKIATNPRARPLAAQLELAISTMKLSARQLTDAKRDQSVFAQEFAVATLTKAAQMMGGPT